MVILSQELGTGGHDDSDGWVQSFVYFILMTGAICECLVGKAQPDSRMFNLLPAGLWVTMFA